MNTVIETAPQIENDYILNSIEECFKELEWRYFESANDNPEITMYLIPFKDEDYKVEIYVEIDFSDYILKIYSRDFFKNKSILKKNMDKLLSFNSDIAFGTLGLEDDGTSIVYKMAYSIKPSESEWSFSKTQFKEYLFHTLWICAEVENYLFEDK